MSIKFDREIFSNENLTLKVNFSGIKNSSVNAADLTMSIYAFDNNGLPKFSETLNCNQIKSLYSHLSQISIIRDSTFETSGKFLETTDEIADILSKSSNIDNGILKIVINKLNSEDRIKNLLIALSDEEKSGKSIIADLSSLYIHQKWQNEINNLRLLLELEESGNIVEEIKSHQNLSDYLASQPEKIFQNWIEKNHNWIFGIEYIKKHEARKIAMFSEADMLMQSIDGFLDLIELKRPTCGLFKFDDSHSSYYPSTDLAKVIGQCMLYFQKMDDFKLNIEKEHKVKIIRPRIKIIAGRTRDFNEDQYNALRMLNCNLNHIEVVSYDYLLSCGEKMIANYTIAE
ncbi:MAG: hypothetical protein JWP37_383 [Mucilaginibacter sp.]|nr:hypothetical protein [Mucilaginibacter sp.]